MKLAQIATTLTEGVQSYPSDWEGFKNDAQSRGFQVTQQNGRYRDWETDRKSVV